MEQKKCPICPRGCDLNQPHCPRGAQYAQTGELPTAQGTEHSHGPHGHGGHPVRLQFAQPEQQLVMKYLHHAVGVADRGALTQADAGQMFTVLTVAETQTLAALLEKLSDHWIALAHRTGRDQ